MKFNGDVNLRQRSRRKWFVLVVCVAVAGGWWWWSELKKKQAAARLLPRQEQAETVARTEGHAPTLTDQAVSGPFDAPLVAFGDGRESAARGAVDLAKVDYRKPLRGGINPGSKFDASDWWLGTGKGATGVSIAGQEAKSGSVGVAPEILDLAIPVAPKDAASFSKPKSRAPLALPRQ